MTSYLKLLSLDGVESTACVAFISDNCKMLFDVGEGTQRLCVEHRFRLAKLDGIFLTEYSPAVLGGIPGLFLTTADSGKSEFQITGPHGVIGYWDATRYFMYRSADVHIAEPLETTSKRCGDVQVTAFVLKSEATALPSKLCYLCETPTLPGKFLLQKAVDLGVPKGPFFSALKSGKSVTLESGVVINPEQVLEEAEKGRKFLIVCRFETEDDPCFDQLVQQLPSSDLETLDVVVHLSNRAVVTSKKYQSWLQRQFSASVVHVAIGQDMLHRDSSFLAASHYSNKLHLVVPELFSHIMPAEPVHDLNGRHESMPDVRLCSGAAAQQFNLLPARVRGLLQDIPCKGEVAQQQRMDELKEITQQLGSANDEGSCGELYQRFSAVRESVKQLQSNRQVVASSDIAADVRKLILEDPAALNSVLFSENLDFCEPCVNHDKELTPTKLSRVSTSEPEVEDNGVPRAGSIKAGELHWGEFAAAQRLAAAREAQLVFLGTACAIPSKYRNVSGILLQVSKSSSILLDVGEGTWQQLLRVAMNNSTDVVFGGDRVVASIETELARQIKAAFISHPHADHHLGLPFLISERARLLAAAGDNNEPLLVIAPPCVIAFLLEYAQQEPRLQGQFKVLSTRQLDPFDDCKSGDCYWCDEDTHGEYPQSTSNWRTQAANDLFYAQCALNSMNIRSMTSVKVIHCGQSYGVSLVMDDGQFLQRNGQAAKDIYESCRKRGAVNHHEVVSCFPEISSPATSDLKVVYSGDTRPCSELVQAGRGAAILIHEATFDDSQHVEAVAKKHSTVSEALEVSRCMGAYRTILTHFSQRYPHVPPLPTASLKAKSAVMAFDFMHVSFGDLLWAPAVTSVLSSLLPDSGDEGDVDEKEVPSDPMDQKKRKHP